MCTNILLHYINGVFIQKYPSKNSSAWGQPHAPNSSSFLHVNRTIPSKKRSLTLSNQHLSFAHTSVILVGLCLRDAIISCEETYCNYRCVQPVFKILHETVSETSRFLVVTPPVISAGCPRHCHMVPVTSFHHPLINWSPRRTALRWLCCVCRQINLRSFWGKSQEPIREISFPVSSV